MCGRYARRSDKQKIAELIAIHGPTSCPQYQPLSSTPVNDTSKRRLARFGDKEDIDGLHEIRARRAFPQRKTFHSPDHACRAGEAAQ
jgi:hypothetical protein